MPNIFFDENSTIFTTLIEAIYNYQEPRKVSDLVLTRFQVGSDIPLVNLTLARQDIRTTSLRVTFLTPLDNDEQADTVLLHAIEATTQREFACDVIRELGGTTGYCIFKNLKPMTMYKIHLIDAVFLRGLGRVYKIRPLNDFCTARFI